MTTKKKGGAPKGNKHALKHGFYAKHFTAPEQKRLDNSDRLSIENEIELIRVCVDRLTSELSFDEIIRTDDKGNETRDTHYLNQLNTLSIMTQALSTMIRTHYLTKGKGGEVEKTIMEAMEELRLEMGI